MNPPKRCASFFVVALTMGGTAFWGTAPARRAGFSAEQTPPAAASTPESTAQANALTPELRGDVFMARKNYADAADYYYRALRQSSFKNPALWNKLGIAYQQENQYSRARNAYSQATRADKNYAEAWNNLGTLYFMAKKYGRSVKYYQRAIELKSDTATFHLNLGTSLYHLKKFGPAVEEYRTALRLDPKVVTERSSVGTVVHASGEDVEFYFYLAKAFASVGNAEDAVRFLRRALEDGFNGSERIEEDPDFKKISQYPAYVELMRNPPVAIKK